VPCVEGFLVEFAEAARIVSGLPLPHTHRKRGRSLYRHIRRNRPENLLELGTARGGSAVFIAAALQENGTGHLTTVDSLRWKRNDPSPHEVLTSAGLREWVTIDASYSTYTWFLKTEIEKNLQPSGAVRPVYDLIFLDGAKNWTTDGLAVILAERLLRPNGWLLLDDLGWTYGKAGRAAQHYDIRLEQMSEEEREQPHLQAIFDLLIRTNPAFDRFLIQDDWWGWAHKSAVPTRRRRGGVLSAAPRTGTDAARSSAAAAPPPPSRSRQVLQRAWRRLPAGVRGRVRPFLGRG
jgi:predicted O-methyltransferase YrrM